MEVTEASPSVASAETNAAVTRVVAVLDGKGVAPADRQTRRLTLRPPALRGRVTPGGFALVASDVEVARARAESAAVADARERAERLAEAAGATVGGVLAIRQDPPRGGGHAQGPGWRSESAGAAVEPGEDDVVVQVTVLFALRT